MTDLTAAVDGVEIKFTVAEDGVEAAMAAFGLTRADATSQTVSFFDALDSHPDLPGPRLLRAGVVLRLRKQEDDDGSGKTTLKLRPAEEGRLTGDWAQGAKRVKDYKVEYDWAREPVLAASVDRDVESGGIAAATGSGGHVRDLFSADQRRFLMECGPALDVPWHDLHIAGPIDALRWKDVETGPFTGKKALRFERWHGAGLTFLEVSARVDHVDDAAETRRRLQKELDDRKITPDPAAESKTQIMLTRFLDPGAGDP